MSQEKQMLAFIGDLHGDSLLICISTIS